MGDEHPSDEKRDYGRQLAIEGILRSRIFERPSKAAAEAVEALRTQAAPPSGASVESGTRPAGRRKRGNAAPAGRPGPRIRTVASAGQGWPVWMKASLAAAAVLLLAVAGWFMLQEDVPPPGGVPSKKEMVAAPGPKEPLGTPSNENKGLAEAHEPVNPNPPPRKAPTGIDRKGDAGNHPDVATGNPPGKNAPPLVGTTPSERHRPGLEPREGSGDSVARGRAQGGFTAPPDGVGGGGFGSAPGMGMGSGAVGGSAPNPELERELAWTAALAAKAPASSGVGGEAVGDNGAKLQAAKEACLRALSFRPKIPERLPGDYRLVALAARETRDGVMLSYAHDRDRVLVFLSPSAGPDVPFEEVGLGKRIVRTARRGGLRIAVEEGAGGPAGPVDYEGWAGLFVK